MQMAARDLRYLWFNDLLKIHGFSKIITAHHLDDSLETFIINLSRGTGLKGLLGIPIKKKYIYLSNEQWTRRIQVYFRKLECMDLRFNV